MPTRVAAQMYTVREFTKTPQAIAATCRKLKSIGFDAVQASALGPIEPKELRKIFDDNGLVCCATHAKPNERIYDVQATIDEHAMLGCRYTAIGGFHPTQGTASADVWRGFIKDYNAAANAYAASGADLRIGYHNHSHEWASFDGVTAIQMLLDGLDPSVWFELDTYWVQHGGGDPAAWIRNVAGRIPVVHLKDMGVRPDRTQYMMEVGWGNLNWPQILEACHAAGVEWYVIEQDVCYRDPFESLRTSLENLRAMGIA